MKPVLHLMLLALSVCAGSTFAAALIQTGTPVYRGSGCPKNSVAITFAPDNLSFSVIYDKMVANLAAGDKRRQEIKACEIWIPVTLPSHSELSIDNIDYRGFVALPTAGHAAIHAGYGFWPSVNQSCQAGGHFTRKFAAPFMDEYLISTGVFDAANKPTSACGGTVYLRLADSLHLRAKKGNDAQITLDSADGALSAQYSLSLKTCK